MGGSLKAEEINEKSVTEDVTHGWYKDGKAAHPSVGSHRAGVHGMERREEIHLGQSAALR